MAKLTIDQQARMSRALRKIAKMIDRELEKAAGQRVAFSIYTWGAFDGDERIQYVGNGERDAVKDTMRRLLEQWDEPPDPPPHMMN